MASEEQIGAELLPTNAHAGSAGSPQRHGSRLPLEIEFPGLRSLDRQEQLSAFERLYDGYAEREVRGVMRKFPGLPYDLAVDAVHKAFLVLWKRVSEVGWDERCAWGYLWVTAVRVAGKAHKKLVFRRQFVAYPPPAGGDDEVADPIEQVAADETIRITAQNNELMQRVDDAIREMPPRQQAVARLMAVNCGERLTPETLLIVYYQAHGEALTVTAAAKALSAVRKKLQGVLVRYRKQCEPH